MTTQLAVLAVIFGIMLAELRLSRQNDKALDAMGATTPHEPQYPVMAIAYPLAFLLMGAEAWWRRDGLQGLFPSGVVLFLGAKALKFWAIGTLGERWSFKVRVLKGAPLVTTGPYQYIAHPNYVAVAGELAATAMMMGASLFGPVMTIVFGVLMWRRARFEERVLAGG